MTFYELYYAGNDQTSFRDLKENCQITKIVLNGKQEIVTFINDLSLDPYGIDAVSVGTECDQNHRTYHMTLAEAKKRQRQLFADAKEMFKSIEQEEREDEQNHITWRR